MPVVLRVALLLCGLNYARSLVIVCVHEASNLPNRDRATERTRTNVDRGSDAFVSLWVEGHARYYTTSLALEAARPTWHECFRYALSAHLTNASQNSSKVNFPM